MRRRIIFIFMAIAILFGVTGCNKGNAAKENTNKTKTEYTYATVENVKSAINDDSWVVVDTRLNDAFNGWKLDGVSRGGHIEGAIDFSANWLRVDVEDKEEQLKKTLLEKGITKDKNVILYDKNGKDAKEVETFLKGQGFEKIQLFDVEKWAADDKLPMKKYENYELIVPAVVVKDILDGKKPETFENAKKIKIIEASWGEEKAAYSKGHIPTAFHINTDEIEPPTTTEPIMWMLAPDEELHKLMLKYGIQKDDTIIAVSDESLAMYRLYTILKYMGVKDVRSMNGANLAWTMAGYELDKTRYEATPVESFGYESPARPEVIDTMEEVEQRLNIDDNFILMDNRTWEEHIGEITGYSYHHKKGRIPGSVYAYAGSTNSYSLDYYRNIDRTMRNFDEVLELWKGRGIDPNKHLSFMCGSGWRVAEIYAYSDVYGLDDIGIFSDGWIGWSNAGKPTITGNPEEK